MILAGLSLQLLESPGVFWTLVALALVAVSVRVYRGGRAGGPLLLALRLATVVVVLALLLDPVLSRFSERTVPPRIALLLDGSASMSIPDPGNLEPGEEPPADPPTRAQRMAAGLRETNLAGRLAREGTLEVYRFGADVTPISADDDSALVPSDDRTDLSLALSEAVGAQRRSTGAVVVLSDGSHNVGVDPRTEARRLGVPVWTVGVGSDAAIDDLSVVDVEASAVAYVDNRVPVVARVKARGDSALTVPVYLSEGDTVVDSVQVVLPEGGGTREVRFDYVPTEEGVHRYRVWTPSRTGEISDTNNEQMFAVRVLKEKIRVLLVASRLGFDFTFLKRGLANDISLSVDPVILGMQGLPGTLGRSRFPATWAELVEYDLVVLSDAGAGTLEPAHAAMIARFVRERGGALLVTGPPRAFDLSSTPLGDLLPVVPEGVPRSRTGQILPSLTASGRSHPVTRLDPDPEANARRWEELPPLGVVPVFQRVRPDARVLAVGALDGVPRQDLPLIATRREGRGRVLTLAGSPYWRWDLYLWGSGRTGDVFARLASRAVRWLVARDDLAPVMVRPAKPLFDGADPVVIEGQIYDDDFRPVSGADVRASIRGPLGTMEERTREISLVELGEGRYRGKLPGLPPGDYRIEGVATLGGQSLGSDESETTVAPYRMEFEDPAPDFALLRDVSRETGGRFLPLEDLAEVPGLLNLEPVLERTVREMPFLENPFLFALLLALLGAEWALRRRRGLP